MPTSSTSGEDAKIRKDLMISFTERFVRTYTVPNKNIEIGAVINDRQRPKIVQLKPLDSIEVERIFENPLYRASLNPALGAKGLVGILKAANGLFTNTNTAKAGNSKSSDNIVKTLLVFVGSLSNTDVRLPKQLLKLQESGVKVVFIVKESMPDEETTKLKRLVSFVRIGDQVTSNDVNMGQNEVSKGMLFLHFLRIWQMKLKSIG